MLSLFIDVNVAKLGSKTENLLSGKREGKRDGEIDRLDQVSLGKI